MQRETETERVNAVDVCVREGEIDCVGERVTRKRVACSTTAPKQ